MIVSADFGSPTIAWAQRVLTDSLKTLIRCETYLNYFATLSPAAPISSSNAIPMRKQAEFDGLYPELHRHRLRAVAWLELAVAAAVLPSHRMCTPLSRLYSLRTVSGRATRSQYRRPAPRFCSLSKAGCGHPILCLPAMLGRDCAESVLTASDSACIWFHLHGHPVAWSHARGWTRR